MPRHQLRASLPLFLGLFVSGCGLLLGLDDFQEGSTTSTSGTGGGTSTSGTGGGTSTGGTGGETTSSSSGGGGGCTPGKTQGCYTGKAGTENIGLCKSGMQTCDPDGVWGACSGDKIPSTEDCSKPEDEDCDGYACSETIWGELFGDTDGQSVRDSASDPMGNVVIVGDFSGSITFEQTLIAGGTHDIYVAKLDKDGKPLWSRQYGDTLVAPRTIRAVAVDTAGNVIIAGYFQGSLIFGTTTLTSVGPGDNVFVAKLDKDGAVVWAKEYGDSGGQEAYDVAVDKLGNVIIAGNTFGKVNFGCGDIDSPSSTVGYVAKLAALDGKCIFSKPVTPSTLVDLTSIAVDTSGNVVAAGSAYNQFSMSQDILIVRYDSVGNLAWSQMYGSGAMSADDTAQGVAVDATGAIYVVGTFLGTLSFISDPSKNLTSAGQQDVALIKLKSGNGSPVWTKRFGDNGAQFARSAAVDGNGAVVFTGSFSDSSIGFGGATHTNTFMAPDAFVAKFGGDGSFVWSHAFGGSLADVLPNASVSMDNTVIFTASTSGPMIDLGKGQIPVMGSTDAAVAKIAP